MRTYQFMIVGAIALVGAAACSGWGDMGPSHSASEDIRNYQQLAVDVESAVIAYGEDMLRSEVTAPATCQQMHDPYDADVRPRIMRMGELSGSMDAFMGEHDAGGMADAGCAAADMMSELDRHHAVACQLADLSANQLEALRHVDMMTSYAAHLNDRSDQMMIALRGGRANWGPMMTGCEDWNGSVMMHGRQ